MHVNIDALGINQLSVGKRLELIEQIWDSLPEQVAPEDVPSSHSPNWQNAGPMPKTSRISACRGAKFSEVMAKRGEGCRLSNRF